MQKTRPLFASDHVLAYAIRLWRAATQLTFAHYTAQTPESQVKVAAKIAEVDESAQAVIETLFEQSKQTFRVVREAGGDIHSDELQSVVGTRVLEHAQVLTGRTALLCEALLAVPPDYAERRQLETAKRDALKALVQAERALEKANGRLSGATRRALVALATAEHGGSIEEAEQHVDARWQ